MSPREPNDDWRVFSAISMIYGIAERPFVKKITPGRIFCRFSLPRVARNESATSGLVSGRRISAWAGTGDGSETSAMAKVPAAGKGLGVGRIPAVGKRRERLAVLAGRCYGRIFQARYSERAVPSVFAGRGAGPFGASSVARRIRFRPAKLGLELGLAKNRVRQFPQHRIHSPAICSRGCWPRSIPRSLASPRVM